MRRRGEPGGHFRGGALRGPAARPRTVLLLPDGAARGRSGRGGGREEALPGGAGGRRRLEEDPAGSGWLGSGAAWGGLGLDRSGSGAMTIAVGLVLYRRPRPRDRAAERTGTAPGV